MAPLHAATTDPKRRRQNEETLRPRAAFMSTPEQPRGGKQASTPASWGAPDRVPFQSRTRPAPVTDKRSRWLTWLIGLAIVAALVLAVRHVAEERAFVRLVGQAQPYWLLVALALQAVTYVFQGEVIEVVLRRAGAAVGVRALCELVVARLAVDQALPSAGLSGTLLVAKALEGRGVPRPVVMATVVIDTASCYATYALGLAAAVVIAASRHHAPTLVVVGAILFVVFALVLTFGSIGLSGHAAGPIAHRLARLRPLAAGLEMLEQADAPLSHSPRLLVLASAYQLAIVVLDAATVWALIASLGASASPLGVFASFMMSTLLRLIGILPGGLGAFEAASVLTLRMVGVELSVALSATLLFRGLSFWLPLAPGLWLSRRLARAAVAPSGQRP
jgi:Mg2+-importing ATPase